MWLVIDLIRRWLAFVKSSNAIATTTSANKVHQGPRVVKNDENRHDFEEDCGDVSEYEHDFSEDWPGQKD